MPSGPAVVNASPLIFLGKAKRLYLLRVLKRSLVVPATVIEEIAKKGADDEVLRSVRESGFLGIVVLAKKEGGIPLAAPVIQELISCGLYVSSQVLDAALGLAGERQGN